MTECIEQPLLFQPHYRQEALINCEGGRTTSDAGGLVIAGSRTAVGGLFISS